MRRFFILNKWAACAGGFVLAFSPVVAVAISEPAPGYTTGLAPSVMVESIQAELNTERWDFLQIKAPQAWALADGGQNVLVAVLDNGIDDTHPALQGKVSDRVNFVESEEVDARQGHGTHIGGLIAAAFEASETGGLAYNAQLLDVVVARPDGRTDAQKVTDGVIWAADHAARVINISITIDEPYPPLEKAINAAWEKGCLIVAAAGNNGLSTAVYPAAYPHVIAVAASDKTDVLANWSARGDWVDVAAPGVEVYSTLPGGQYGFKSGTSFSSALVSGEAALLWDLAQDLNRNGRINDEVEQLVLANCDGVDGWSPAQEGWPAAGGRINVWRALQALK
jgi:thermitase